LQGFWESRLRLLWTKLKNDVRRVNRIFRVWDLRPLVMLSRNTWTRSTVSSSSSRLPWSRQNGVITDS